MSEWKVDATKILSGAEIGQVLADLKRRAKRSVNSRMNLIVFRLATCCGLRVSEIIGLRIGDVRVGVPKPYLNLRREITKRHKPRRVPLRLATVRRFRRFAQIRSGKNEAFVLQGSGAEIDQEADLLAGGLQVVDHLGFVHGCQGGQGFQFDDHGVEADEIGAVVAGQPLALVEHGQVHFAPLGDAAGRQFLRERCVVHRFEEPAAQLTLHLHGRANDRIRPRVPLLA